MNVASKKRNRERSIISFSPLITLPFSPLLNLRFVIVNLGNRWNDELGETREEIATGLSLAFPFAFSTFPRLGRPLLKNRVISRERATCLFYRAPRLSCVSTVQPANPEKRNRFANRLRGGGGRVALICREESRFYAET